MGTSRPCKEFKEPTKAQGYPAFCGKCHFSRRAHERWDEWDQADQRRARHSADVLAQPVEGKTR